MSKQRKPHYSVMRPVQLESGTTTLVKIGVIWDQALNRGYKIQLVDLPLKYQNTELKLYLYPVREKQK